MEKMADIYIITNLINGKQYVGQTIKSYLTRFNQHCIYANTGGKRKSPQLIDTKIKQYGVSNFKVELLETVPIQDKDAKEIYYIAKYNTYSKGYNQTPGGDYNPMFDQDIKAKHKSKMQSVEHRLKVSQSINERNKDPKHRDKYRQKTINRWYNEWDDSQKQNCIKGLLASNNAKKVQIGIIDDEDNLIKKFSSASEACIYCGRSAKEASNLLRNCDKYNKNNKRAKYYGYYWTKL